MRLLWFLAVILAVGGGGWYVWENYPPVRQFVEDKLPTAQNFIKDKLSKEELYSFKIRHTAEALMETHKGELIRDSDAKFLEAELTYFPYLLMEVKFAKNAALTQEGALLWGLTDGEMVIDALSWEKTHGFEDCLVARATRDDFRVLRALIEGGGVMDREKIYQKFKVETETVDAWLESCRKKRLIVISGNKFRLHFQNPKLEITPMTRLDEWLVTLPPQPHQRGKRRYSATTVQQFANDLFGSDFVIRRTSEVYLPVYTLTVQNPDGTLLITRWNALSGRRIGEEKAGGCGI